MGWNYFIYSQTSMAAPLKLGNGQVINPKLYNGCNYLFMLGLVNLCWQKGPQIQKIGHSLTSISLKSLQRLVAVPSTPSVPNHDVLWQFSQPPSSQSDRPLHVIHDLTHHLKGCSRTRALTANTVHGNSFTSRCLSMFSYRPIINILGLDCSNSSALAMELL